ncbi:polysaccharide pyruvyl transferase family protein [Gudongella sp. DL1XJH-153]|uniref:polysaccharide pyruvyl transferase family protein n=1 Tax=Gudongella sp. DL1XJH-153 TaxID=3409804 RepID=UPI003BB6415C
MPWLDRLKINFAGTILSTINKSIKYKKYKLFNNEVNSLKKILEDSDYIIDVSGYALSSQRGIRRSFDYLINILIAKKHGIKMYLMPQSFGPFYYGKGYKLTMKRKVV